MTVTIKGFITPGKQKATALGFPTANFLLSIPDKSLAGVWVGIVKTNKHHYYNTFYGIGSISANGKNAEVHIRGLTQIAIPQYGDPLEFTLVSKVADKKTKLIEDVKLLRTCDDCKFCLHDDYGYSNWTVEGTSSECLKELRDSHDAHEVDPLSLTASTCPSFLLGGYIDQDCDRESPVPEDYVVNCEIELKNLK